MHFRKDDKISSLSAQLDDALLKLQDNEQDLLQLHDKERELLSFNKEMSESIVDLQNQICLAKSKVSFVYKAKEKYSVLITTVSFGRLVLPP